MLMKNNQLYELPYFYFKVSVFLNIVFVIFILLFLYREYSIKSSEGIMHEFAHHKVKSIGKLAEKSSAKFLKITSFLKKFPIVKLII